MQSTFTAGCHSYFAITYVFFCVPLIIDQNMNFSILDVVYEWSIKLTELRTFLNMVLTIQ